MEVTPDLIYLKIVISEQDARNRQSVNRQEQAMLKALEKLGIDTKTDLLIRDLSSNYKFYFLKSKDIMLSKEYQLLVHDGKMAGRVLMELENIGISNVSVMKEDHSRMEELRLEVKVAAVKEAKKKAAAMAGAVGQQIGRALFIQEFDSPPVYYRNQNVMLMKAANDVSSESIADLDFEKMRLEYSVLVKFELK